MAEFTEEITDSEKRTEVFKQLILDYKALFNSERGQRVLADMHQRFGFMKPSARKGDRAEDVFIFEGMKMPFYHIKRFTEWSFPKRPKDKPEKATTE